MHPVRILGESQHLADEGEIGSYMSEFRDHGKPYLLAEEVKDGQLHTRRQRWAPRHPMSDTTAEAGSSSTRMQELTSMAVPPLG
ncbi:hypothetical protein PVK06_026289 [Gossypium arboreum]|uniref:Uncharacterized protein n=1 Tax=Gossypium arboreum TaxID=29729 RepID=A0ABR0NZR0_GOSAR|nr:hypothetical protein PVK06_026289 [Gossypium arboreum]